MRCEVIAQRLLILSPAFGAADGIYVKLYITQPCRVEYRLCEGDDLGIGTGVFGTLPQSEVQSSGSSSSEDPSPKASSS